jgi:hypothetical protein
VLWLLSAAALAGGRKPEPAPSAPAAAAPAGVITAAEAGAYVQQVIPQVQAVTSPVRAQIAGVLLELGAAPAEQRRLALCAAARDGEPRLAAISPFPSDDALREAGVTWARTVAAECEGDLAKWIALRVPIVSDADVADAAALGEALERRLRDADAAWFDTVAAFTSRHGVRLTLTQPPKVPEWDSPGLVPPDQSALPRMVAQLSLAYALQLEPPVKGMSDAYESWRAAVVQWKGPAGDAHVASKGKVLRATDALGRVQPWLGDPKLLDAAKAFGAAVERVLDGQGAEITKKSVAGPTSQREVEALNVLLKQCDDELLAATARWNEAVSAFRERWRVPVYQEWLKTALAPR